MRLLMIMTFVFGISFLDLSVRLLIHLFNGNFEFNDLLLQDRDRALGLLDTVLAFYICHVAPLLQIQIFDPERFLAFLQLAFFQLDSRRLFRPGSEPDASSPEILRGTRTALRRPLFHACAAFIRSFLHLF